MTLNPKHLLTRLAMWWLDRTDDGPPFPITLDISAVYLRANEDLARHPEGGAWCRGIRRGVHIFERQLYLDNPHLKPQVTVRVVESLQELASADTRRRPHPLGWELTPSGLTA